MSDAWRPTGFSVGPFGAPDRYALGPAVGSGAEGILYRASLTTASGLEFEVAIKMLQPRFLSKVDEWEERWSEQVEVLRSLQVPGVVSVRDGFTGTLPHLTGDEGQGRTLYLVMNWVEGEPLDEWVRRNPDRDPLEDLRMLLPVAAALDLMHSGGPTGGIPVVHRDVKPANILVSDCSSVLVDFGLTRGLPEGQRLSGVTGTPGYLAPECQQDGLYTPASDRYGFGAVVFFVLTGTELPIALDPARLEDEVRRAPILAERPELAARVLAMLAPDPDDRPPSLANWIGQLRQSSLPDLPAVLAPAARSRQAAVAVAPSLRPVQASGDGAPGAHSARRWAMAQLGTTRRRVAAAAVSLVVVATAVAFGAATGTQANTHSAVRYAFQPELFDSSLIADRTWTLSGTNGNHLLGTVTLYNETAQRIKTTYTEVIPEQVAKTVGALQFDPAPNKIVKVDPVVRYKADLRPGTSRTLSYQAEVGKTAGAWMARLQTLAHQQGVDETNYLKSVGQKAPATLDQLTISPSTLPLGAGQTQKLRVTGRMTDGTVAAPAALAGIAWASSEPAVASVANGTVHALNPGTTKVTAQAGSLVSAATVTVTGSPTASSRVAVAAIGKLGTQLLRSTGSTGSTDSTSTAARARLVNASPGLAGQVPPTTSTTRPPHVGGGTTTTTAPPTTTTPPPPTDPPTTAPPATDPPTTAPPDTDPPTTAPPDTDPPTTPPPDTDPTTTTTVPSTAATTTIGLSGTPLVPPACTTTVECGGLTGSFDLGTTVTNISQVCVTIQFSPGLASGWEVEVDITGNDLISRDLGGWYNNGGTDGDGNVLPASGPADATTICSDSTQDASTQALFDSLAGGTGTITIVDNALVGGNAAIGSPDDPPFGVVGESITVTGTVGG